MGGLGGLAATMGRGKLGNDICRLGSLGHVSEYSSSDTFSRCTLVFT
jgi:hypothetical protein